MRLARAALHFWEEPPISGESGSGTVFFSGCPLRCVYCQNKSIARGEVGRGVSIERLAHIFLEQQERGALNINLVTPTHFATQIKAALDLARSDAFSDTPLVLPIVYNTSGYELPEAIAALDGYVDVFLTDFKYASADLAGRYSSAPDYPDIASRALDAMFELVGPLRYARDEKGEPYRDDIIVSIMNQFTPSADLADTFPELDFRVSEDEYDELIDYVLDLGIVNSFMQEGDTADESFIPSFDYEGV